MDDVHLKTPVFRMTLLIDERGKQYAPPRRFELMEMNDPEGTRSFLNHTIAWSDSIEQLVNHVANKGYAVHVIIDHRTDKTVGRLHLGEMRIDHDAIAQAEAAAVGKAGGTATVELALALVQRHFSRLTDLVRRPRRSEAIELPPDAIDSQTVHDQAERLRRSVEDVMVAERIDRDIQSVGIR